MGVTNENDIITILNGLDNIAEIGYAWYVNNKANKTHIHNMSDISDLSDALSVKADVDQVYDRWTVDQMIDEHDHNDIYYSKNEVDNNFATVEDHLSLLEDLSTKADIDHRHDDIYYTKEEVEEEIKEGLESIDLTGYVKQEEMAAALSGKADIDHRHDDDYAAIEHDHLVEDIKDIKDFFYDKETTDAMLNTKADVGHGHDISEIKDLPEELDKKANKEGGKSEEVFSVDKPKLQGPNVVDKINLDGQSKGGDKGDKKKRKRIGGERVDVSKAMQGGGQPQGGGQKEGKKKNKNQKTIHAPIVSEEDVARQVKETLARLTEGNKGVKKGAKYRKEKREANAQRLQNEQEMEQLESKILKLTEFVTANELAAMMNVIYCFFIILPING